MADEDLTPFIADAMIDESWRCSPTVDPPSAEYLRQVRAEGWFVGTHSVNGRLRGLIVARPNGTVKWLIVRPYAFVETAKELVGQVVAVCGDCRGLVDNPRVRAALLTAGYDVNGRWVTFPKG